MRGGTLDTRVILQRMGAPGDDGLTATPGEWGNIKAGPDGAVWASERSASGSERFASAEVAANQVAIFRVREDPDLADLNPKDQLIREADGEVFNILNVNHIRRDGMIEITAAARRDD